MRVLDIGTGGTLGYEGFLPGAELVDYNVIKEDDPKKEINLQWITSAPGKRDRIKGTFDLILFTRSLRYNYDEKRKEVDHYLVQRVCELTHQGSWVEIVEYYEDLHKEIAPTKWCRMFIEPFFKKGFKLRDEVNGQKMIFVRLIKQ